MPIETDESFDPVTGSYDPEAGRQRPRTSASVGGSVAGAQILGPKLARANTSCPSLRRAPTGTGVEPQIGHVARTATCKREKRCSHFLPSVHFSSLEGI